MILPWHDVAIGDGPAISTSLTANESAALLELAAGEFVIEVGAAYGYSAILMAQVAEHVVSIDPHMGYGSVPDSLAIMQANLEAYGVCGWVSMMTGKQAYDALELLAEIDSRPGLVFIDGDHREHAVRADVTTALEMSPRVACHDYGEESCPDVRKVLDSLDVTPTRIIDTLWIWEQE